MPDALRWASTAAALSVQRPGAQDSMPTRAETDAAAALAGPDPEPARPPARPSGPAHPGRTPGNGPEAAPGATA